MEEGRRVHDSKRGRDGGGERKEEREEEGNRAERERESEGRRSESERERQCEQYAPSLTDTHAIWSTPLSRNAFAFVM